MTLRVPQQMGMWDLLLGRVDTNLESLRQAVCQQGVD